MSRLEKAREFRKRIDANLQATRKLIRVDELSEDDWLPDGLPALYLNLMPDSVIPEWVQPVGSHDVYNIGDKVIFEGEVYESTIDNNTWSPKDYPAGWRAL